MKEDRWKLLHQNVMQFGASAALRSNQLSPSGETSGVFQAVNPDDGPSVGLRPH